MPDPHRLLQTLTRARALQAGLPGRRGRVLTVSDLDDLVVGGDLHGHLGNFQTLMRIADLGRHPRRHLVLQELIHGPFRYPDGSDKSHQLVDLVSALICQFPGRVHFLPGNHELAQATGRHIGKGESEYNLIFRQGVDFAYGDQAHAIYAAYLDLIAAAPLLVRTPNRVIICHSFPSRSRLPGFDYADLLRDSTPSDLEHDGPIYALVWGRDTSLANAEAFLNKVDGDWLITGHIVCEQGFYAPNRRQLILDSLGTPASACRISTTSPLDHADLLAGVLML